MLTHGMGSTPPHHHHLGVNFQYNLQFDKHVANIRAKANRTVQIIKHAFSCINIDMFRILLEIISQTHFGVLLERMEPLY